MRERTVKLAALNIAANPHPKGIYQALLSRAVDVFQPSKYWGKRNGLIGTVYLQEPGVLSGEIYTFTQIDDSQPWLNLRKRKVTSKEELAEIRRTIAYNLPEFKPIEYLFFEHDHLMIIEVSKFSPDRVAEVVRGQLNQDEVRSPTDTKLTSEFVSVTVVPTHESIETILSMPVMDYIRIELTAPNTDDLESAAEKFRAKLSSMNAKKEIIEYHASSGQGLQLDEEVKVKARIAPRNGLVYAKGYDSDDRRTEEKTSDHPWIERRRYNPKTTGLYEIMQIAAANIRGGVR